jgi:hypothetical protein
MGFPLLTCIFATHTQTIVTFWFSAPHAAIKLFALLLCILFGRSWFQILVQGTVILRLSLFTLVSPRKCQDVILNWAITVNSTIFWDWCHVVSQMSVLLAWLWILRLRPYIPPKHWQTSTTLPRLKVLSTVTIAESLTLQTVSFLILCNSF